MDESAEPSGIMIKYLFRKPSLVEPRKQTDLILPWLSGTSGIYYTYKYIHKHSENRHTISNETASGRQIVAEITPLHLSNTRLLQTTLQRKQKCVVCVPWWIQRIQEQFGTEFWSLRISRCLMRNLNLYVYSRISNSEKLNKKCMRMCWWESRSHG